MEDYTHTNDGATYRHLFGVTAIESKTYEVYALDYKVKHASDGMIMGVRNLVPVKESYAIAPRF